MTEQQTYTDWQMKSGHVVTGVRQQRAISRLLEVGPKGLTTAELATIEAPNKVSGTSTWGAPLTLLRQAGLVKALAERRNGGHIYVMPEYVGQRATWAGYQHGGGHCQTCTCKGAR